jgi:hypothetical protein
MSAGSSVRILAIDIETISQGKNANDFIDKCHKFKAPSNYSDEKKIAAYIDKERGKEVSKHGLYWWRGRVLSIATVDCRTGESKFYFDYDEKQVLNELREDLDKGQVRLWSKSGKTFDYPYLVGRYMANKIELPRVFKSKPFDSVLNDVDEFFGRSSASAQRTKLDYYAWGLGLENKPMNGGQVQSLYNQMLDAKMRGDEAAEAEAIVKLKEYNIFDSTVVAEMVKRFFGGDL